MYCNKCGNPVDEENTFCAKCGNRIHSGDNQSQVNLSTGFWQDIKAFLKSNKKVIGILLLIVSLFLMMCAVIDLIQSGGQSSSNSWRGPEQTSAPTGPLDITLIIIAVLGIFTSYKLLKTK